MKIKQQLRKWCTQAVLFCFFLTETLTLHHLSLRDWGYVNIAKNTVRQLIGQKLVDFFKWRTLHLEPSYVLNSGSQFKLSAQAHNSFMTDNCYFYDGCFIFTIIIQWQTDTSALLHYFFGTLFQCLISLTRLSHVHVRKFKEEVLGRESRIPVPVQDTINICLSCQYKCCLVQYCRHFIESQHRCSCIVSLA